jgi:hypothetical protein
MLRSSRRHSNDNPCVTVSPLHIFCDLSPRATKIFCTYFRGHVEFIAAGMHTLKGTDSFVESDPLTVSPSQFYHSSGWLFWGLRAVYVMDCAKAWRQNWTGNCADTPEKWILFHGAEVYWRNPNAYINIERSEFGILCFKNRAFWNKIVKWPT